MLLITLKVAIVTGIAGQDGSYLAEHLISRGYFVIGVDRRRVSDPRSPARPTVRHLSDNPSLKIIDGDITDPLFMTRLIADYKPEKFFNLAAMSHVGQSFKQPVATFDIDARAVIVQLDAIKRFSPDTHYYQASTSELYGGLKCPDTGYTEQSPFHPRSPYGVAKLAAYWAVVNYREAFGLFASNGILFNHESPRRGSDFVTRKITLGVAAIARGEASTITLGNLDAKRDWGFAGDYVVAMDTMLDYKEPGDFIVATGYTAPVQEFLIKALRAAELDWKNWEQYIEYDPRFMRPSEVPVLLGDPTKIKEELGWEASTDLDQLVTMMVEHDLVQ